MADGVVVLAVVAGGDHVERLRVFREGVAFRRAFRRAAEREVCHLSAVGPRVVDRRDDRRGGAAAFAQGRCVGTGPQRHDPRVLRDAADADAVVAGGTDRAGGVHPVAAGDQIVVGRVGVLAGAFRAGPDEVIAMHVVDEPVAVVVDPVAWYLAWIDPGDRPEVGAVEAVARVDIGDYDRGRSHGQVPGAWSVDVGPCDGAGEVTDPGSKVAQAPLLGKQRVVGNRGRGAVAVAFGDKDRRVGIQRLDRRRGRLTGFDFDQLEARVAEICL